MSTDDFGDRTQRPTERRRREARARGEVARSSDLVNAVVLLSAAAAFWWLGPSLGMELAGLMRSGLSTAPSPMINEQIIATQLLLVATRVSVLAAPILLIIIAAAAFSNLVQTGFLWVPASVLPQFARLDPARGFGRWWGMSAWVGLVGSIVKLAVLLGVLLVYVRIRMASAGPLVEGSPLAIFTLASRLLGELSVVLSLSLLVMAILDYGYQFWHQECQLMMTVEEVRREHREDQGNPELKRHRREVAATVAPNVDGVRSV